MSEHSSVALHKIFTLLQAGEAPKYYLFNEFFNNKSMPRDDDFWQTALHIAANSDEHSTGMAFGTILNQLPKDSPLYDLAVQTALTHARNPYDVSNIYKLIPQSLQQTAHDTFFATALRLPTYDISEAYINTYQNDQLALPADFRMALLNHYYDAIFNHSPEVHCKMACDTVDYLKYGTFLKDMVGYNDLLEKAYKTAIETAQNAKPHADRYTELANLTDLPTHPELDALRLKTLLQHANKTSAETRYANSLHVLTQVIDDLDKPVYAALLDDAITQTIKYAKTASNYLTLWSIIPQDHSLSRNIKDKIKPASKEYNYSDLQNFYLRTVREGHLDIAHSLLQVLVNRIPDDISPEDRPKSYAAVYGVKPENTTPQIKSQALEGMFTALAALDPIKQATALDALVQFRHLEDDAPVLERLLTLRKTAKDSVETTQAQTMSIKQFRSALKIS